MTKRYRERLDAVQLAEQGQDDRGDAQPDQFQWRGQTYRVLSVLGHWREDPGWWRRPDGQPIRIEQTDLWRVEARNGTPTRGVYELVHRAGTWTLDRVWD